jgi:formylglycine-generating enzyme required for sulfatase activity
MDHNILSLILISLISFYSCSKDDSVTFPNDEKFNEMIFLEGGAFWMGDSSLAPHLETPVHKVNLSDFFISRYEISQIEWNRIMNFNPSIQKGNYLPVSKILWIDAIIYCNERSRIEGLTSCYVINDSDNVLLNLNCNGYRLPTEAEWEYAAKGGKQSQKYNFSGSDSLNEVGWYRANSNQIIKEVGIKKPNEIGLYDMSGNVYEWCWDRFTNYDSLEVINPIGPSTGIFRIIRGGSFEYFPDQALVTFRSINIPEDNFYNCGLRIVRSFK